MSTYLPPAQQYTASGAPANRRRTGTPALPPMPTTSDRCRWCGSLLLFPLPDWAYCQHGCAPNETAPYLGHCRECLRDFDTGKPWAERCHECESAENVRIDASYGPPEIQRAEAQRADDEIERAEAGDAQMQLELRRRQFTWYEHRHPNERRTA